MVALGTDAGVHTVALLTDMSTPLGLHRGQRDRGRRVGRGARRRRAGRRGRADPRAGPRDARRRRSRRRRPGRQAGRRVRDGRLEGDDPRAGRRSGRRRCRRPRESHVVTAPSSGVLTRLDAMAVGLAAWRLGAGRARKEDPVQAGAGVVWHARPGDEVTEGAPLFTLLTDEPDRFERALGLARGRLRHRAARHGVHPGPAGHRPGRLVEQQHHVRGDARGLVDALDLDRVLDDQLLARRQVGDLAEADVRAQPAADRAPGAGSGPSPGRS